MKLCVLDLHQLSSQLSFNGTLRLPETSRLCGKVGLLNYSDELDGFKFLAIAEGSADSCKGYVHHAVPGCRKPGLIMSRPKVIRYRTTGIH